MTAYADRDAFINANRFRLNHDQLDYAAAYAVRTARYSAAYERRLLRKIEDGLVQTGLLRLVWNAATWVGVDPTRLLDAAVTIADAEDYAAADLADEMADDETDDADSFPALTVAEAPARIAGDCDVAEPDVLTLLVDLDDDDPADDWHDLDLPAFLGELY